MMFIHEKTHIFFKTFWYFIKLHFFIFSFLLTPNCSIHPLVNPFGAKVRWECFENFIQSLPSVFTPSHPSNNRHHVNHCTKIDIPKFFHGKLWWGISGYIMMIRIHTKEKKRKKKKKSITVDSNKVAKCFLCWTRNTSSFFFFFFFKIIGWRFLWTFSLHASLASFLILLFRNPHLLKGALK